MKMPNFEKYENHSSSMGTMRISGNINYRGNKSRIFDNEILATRRWGSGNSEEDKSNSIVKDITTLIIPDYFDMKHSRD